MNSGDKEQWYQRVWRPSAAATYLIICIFDFIVMPIIVEYHTSDVNYEAFDKIYKLESSDAQVAAINRLDLGGREWKPLTLQGGSTFHLAFGALLTGAAVTRGLEKRSKIENPPRPENNT